ncbi:MAG TPA: FAD-dependent tricarballylate dehydrogenase TcuA [Candidatus Acidoferrales bacterium]|nr:FAD-dependent tricarballylate dehydrogenase TcuA [Candidatus Acidoferrales bacterium]
MSENCDVIVVGGGNAALCAALAAREAGARVLVLERSPEHARGGNTRHTRNIRCSHPAADPYFSGPYPEEEHLQDLIGVTGGPANLDLARLAVRESSTLPAWMSAHGVHWQQPLAGTLHLGRTNRWFLGGGKALLNTYYQTAARMGIDVRYNALVEDLVIENNRFDAVRLKNGNGGELIRARAVIIAAGGYEANIEWLKRHWGDAAENFIIRGTPYNDGTLLAALLKHGAKTMGDPKGFHAIAVDARAPKFDGGIVTRLDATPFGIVVNREGRRFYDEGEDIWPKRYAIWGTLIARQPGQIAFSIVDAKTIDRFLPPMFKPFRADSLEALAPQLGLDPGTFVETVTGFNRAAAGNAELCMDRLDGNATRGVAPPKSNWAIPIDRPPFYGLPLRPGITFTYMGVAVDERARVLDERGRPFQNVYAAGEIMSGNILTKGYLGGFGLTIGSVFGRLAGREAAQNARA